MKLRRRLDPLVGVSISALIGANLAFGQTTTQQNGQTFFETDILNFQENPDGSVTATSGGITTTFPANTVLVQGNTLFLTQSGLALAQAAGLSLVQLGAGTGLLAVGGIAAFLNRDDSDPAPESNPTTPPSSDPVATPPSDPTPPPPVVVNGHITDGATTIDLGQGFTINLGLPDSGGLYGALQSFDILGSMGDDTIGTATDNQIARSGAVVNIDLSPGGNNTVIFGLETGGLFGTMNIKGGAGNDSITMGQGTGISGGQVSIDLSAGGNNNVNLDLTPNVAAGMGTASITGGQGVDDITLTGSTTQSTTTVDLGDNDGMADTITIKGATTGRFKDLTVDNFEMGDKLVIKNGSDVAAMVPQDNGSGGVRLYQPTLSAFSTFFDVTLNGVTTGQLTKTTTAGDITFTFV